MQDARVFRQIQHPHHPQIYDAADGARLPKNPGKWNQPFQYKVAQCVPILPGVAEGSLTGGSKAGEPRS